MSSSNKLKLGTEREKNVVKDVDLYVCLQVFASEIPHVCPELKAENPKSLFIARRLFMARDSVVMKKLYCRKLVEEKFILHTRASKTILISLK